MKTFIVELKEKSGFVTGYVKVLGESKREARRIANNVIEPYKTTTPYKVGKAFEYGNDIILNKIGEEYWLSMKVYTVRVNEDEDEIFMFIDADVDADTTETETERYKMSKGMLEQIRFVIESYRLPDLKVGDVVTIDKVWDGRNVNPLYDKSYSYQLSPYEWLNYRWKIVDENTQTIVITAIEFI